MPPDISSDVATEMLKGLDIPPCPAVALNLIREARSDEVDFGKVVRLISGDVGLAASMMKTANSPFFGLAKKVSTVQQTVTVLGLKNILQIVLGLSLKHSFAASKLQLDRFWERSNYHAIVAHGVARRMPGISRDDAYTYGLFHECGVPILMMKFPDYKETMIAANNAPGDSLAVEEGRHGTNHAVAGYMLAKTWGLPECIYQAIRHHHNGAVLRDEIAGVGAEVSGLVATGLVGEHIVAHYQNYTDDSNWRECGEAAKTRLGITQKELEDIREDICDELEDMKELRQ